MKPQGEVLFLGSNHCFFHFFPCLRTSQKMSCISGLPAWFHLTEGHKSSQVYFHSLKSKFLALSRHSLVEVTAKTAHKQCLMVQVLQSPRRQTQTPRAMCQSGCIHTTGWTCNMKPWICIPKSLHLSNILHGLKSCLTDTCNVLEKSCRNWGCFRKQVTILYILLPELHQHHSQAKHTGNSWPQGFTLAEWIYCPEQPAYCDIYTLMSAKIHREKSQTFPSSPREMICFFKSFTGWLHILRFSYWVHFHPPLWFISCCRASMKRYMPHYHQCTDETQLSISFLPDPDTAAANL